MSIFKKLANDYKAVITNPFRSTDNKIVVQTGLGALAQKTQSVTGAIRNEIAKVVVPQLAQKALTPQAAAETTKTPSVAVQKKMATSGFNLGALAQTASSSLFGNTGINGGKTPVSGAIGIQFGNQSALPGSSTQTTSGVIAVVLPFLAIAAVIGVAVLLIKKLF